MAKSTAIGCGRIDYELLALVIAMLYYIKPRSIVSVLTVEAALIAFHIHIAVNMSDQPKPSAKAIPEWQRDKSSNQATNPPEAPLHGPGEPADNNPGSRAALIEQASKFLEDPETKPATTERKIQFLESKGLTNHEIFEMLGIARKEDGPTKVDSEVKAEKVLYNPSTLA